MQIGTDVQGLVARVGIGRIGVDKVPTDYRLAHWERVGHGSSVHTFWGSGYLSTVVLGHWCRIDSGKGTRIIEVTFAWVGSQFQHFLCPVVTVEYGFLVVTDSDGVGAVAKSGIGNIS